MWAFYYDTSLELYFAALDNEYIYFLGEEPHETVNIPYKNDVVVIPKGLL